MSAAGRPYAVIAAFIVLAKLLLFALAGTRYGFLSDELYFLDAAARPAWGYVDLPPLLPWLLGAGGLDSLSGMRLTAAVIGAAATLVGVDLCRILGGRPPAAWLVALVLLFAPGFLSVQSIMTMNVLDQLWWLVALWLVVRQLQTGTPHYVLALGLVLGLGALTKLSILALGAAIPLAWAIWARGVFGTASTWWAAGIALLVVAPHFIWQATHDWPLLQFIAAYNATAPNALVLRDPLLGIALTMHPLYGLFWGPGAVYALASQDTRLRVIGTAAWISIAVFIVAGVKFYFAVPAFSAFVIAGALFWQRVLATRGRAWQAALLAVAGSGVLAVPAAAPVLPEARLQQVVRFLRDGEQGYPGTEAANLERYFPHFAEMHGWPELVALTTRLWAGLSPEERAGAILFAAHYGQAGALNQLDAAEALPPAFGRHMSYHAWSDGLAMDRGLFVGFTAEELAPLYRHVELRGNLDCRACMAREQQLSVYYVAGRRLPALEIRRRLQRYDFY